LEGVDADGDFDKLAAAAESDAFNGSNIAIIAAPAESNMAVGRDHVIGRVKGEPAGTGNKGGDPGVGGFGTLVIGSAAEISANVPGGEAKAAEGTDHDMGEVLTDAAAILEDVGEGHINGCGLGDVLKLKVNAVGEVFEGFDERAARREGGFAECGEVRGGGDEGRIVNEFRGFKGGIVGAFGEDFAGLFPTEGGEDADAGGFDFHDGAGGDGEAVVGFEDGKSGDFVAEPVFAGAPKGGFGFDVDLELTDALTAELAGSQPKFVDTLRDRLFVDMPGDMGGAVNHSELVGRAEAGGLEMAEILSGKCFG
jgi:hypothetical protein